MRSIGLNDRCLDFAYESLQKFPKTAAKELTGILFHLEKDEKEWRCDQGPSGWVINAIKQRREHADDPWEWEGPEQRYPKELQHLIKEHCV